MSKKYQRRNFQKEAKLQTDLLKLQREGREQFLMNFSSTEELVDVRDTKAELNIKTHIPINAKSILEKWMYDHRFYCYPTKIEKQQLAIKTNLSVQKVTNWFINSRRRILPKLLETEGINPTSFTISRRKKSEIRKMVPVPPMDSNNNNNHNFVLPAFDDFKKNLVIDQPVQEPSASVEASYDGSRVVTGILKDVETQSKFLYFIVPVDAASKGRNFSQY